MIRFLTNALLAKRDRFDAFLSGASSIVIITIIKKIICAVSELRTRKDELKGYIIDILRLIPSVRSKINAEKLQAKASIERTILSETSESMLSLPPSGSTKESILAALESKAAVEAKHWSQGNLTGAVYSLDEELSTIQAKALALFNKSNLLHPDIFASTRQMEAEVIRMTLDLFDADALSCGSVTSGGTESILLAVKAYRDRFKRKRPNLVIPSTAHAAFIKAGEYLGVEIRRAHCDARLSYEVDLASMEALIDRNTIALIGSAPAYPHGTMDPIPAIAALAKRHSIGCHVDACLGSFLLPFLKDELPYRFGFELDGVSSISCDIHKYAFAPKGSSVLMWRSEDFRKYQYSICTDWEGGLYATPTISGSRSSSAAVAAWATLMYFGREGYEQCALKIKAGAQLIARTVVTELSDYLMLMGRVDTSVVSFTTREGLDIYDIADFMKTQTELRWSLAMLQRPAGVHFAVTMANVDNCAQFSEDLKSAVRHERERIKAGGKVGSSESAVIYGSTASVPKSLVKELVVDYLDVCYKTG
jgi:sphinganine-1-phosphate aldolase